MAFEEQSRTLKLPLKWGPFWLIYTGQKRNEYRAAKPWYADRLFTHPGLVHLTDENSPEYEELKKEYDFVYESGIRPYP